MSRVQETCAKTCFHLQHRTRTAQPIFAGKRQRLHCFEEDGQRRIREAVITLAPALSHPMGEGESFDISLKNETVSFSEPLSKIKERSIAVPSPIGWERVRVRV